MKTNHAREVSKQAFEELVTAVEAGKSQKLVAYLKAMGKVHNYSLGNAILIGFQKPNATHVAGFRTWRRLGRYVKKGEHGIAIMAPIVYRRKIETEEADDRETEDETARTFKTVHIFDVSQTDGKPLPDFAKVDGDPGIYAEKLREYVASRVIKLEYSEAIGAADGISCGGVIKLKKGLSAAEEFSVLIHELAHEMVHKKRDSMLKGRKVRETEAEAVAFVVCHGIGLDVSSASSDYIQLYNGDKKTLLESLGRIQRTATEILAAITEDGKSGIETGRESVCPVAAA